MAIPCHEIPFNQFGIEFEFFGPEALQVKDFLSDIGLRKLGWELGIDSSVNKNHGKAPEANEGASESTEDGLELKSPPLAGALGMAQLRGACRMLEALGADFNATTGLHMHFDASNLDFAAIKRVLKAFLVYEEALEFFTGITPARMHNRCSYAKSLQQVFAEDGADVHRSTEEQLMERERIAGALYARGIPWDIWQAREAFTAFEDKGVDERVAAIRKGIALIDASEDLAALIKLIGHDRNMKLNIMALEIYRTFEYRQPGAVYVCFNSLRRTLLAFDMFFTAAIDDALPMDKAVYESGLDRKQSILFTLFLATPMPQQGYVGLRWRPGMATFARRFWPNFTLEQGVGD